MLRAPNTWPSAQRPRRGNGAWGLDLGLNWGVRAGKAEGPFLGLEQLVKM